MIVHDYFSFLPYLFTPSVVLIAVIKRAKREHSHSCVAKTKLLRKPKKISFTFSPSVREVMACRFFMTFVPTSNL